MSHDGYGGIAVYSAILSEGPQQRAQDTEKALLAQADHTLQARSPRQDSQ